MKANGWKGDAIDAVRMGDGKLTSLDNTRVLAASRAGINVKANIHNANSPIPANIAGRFKSRSGQVPSTYGEAALNRIGRQNSGFRTNNPLGSSITGSVD
jgi:hypothetical protein